MVARLGYCVVPEAGGLFRFYRNLRTALAPHAWQVFAVSLGPQAATRRDPAFADEGCVLLAPDETDPKRQAMALAAWVEENHVDVIMPMDNNVAASAVPHLPPAARLVTRCSSNGTFAYRICVFCLERLSRVIAMTPRQLHGLGHFRRLPKSRISMIPHGVDLSIFSRNPTSTIDTSGRPLRIVYGGRLDDKTKGTLWLPEIAAKLASLRVEFQFDIIGDGEDRLRLSRLLKRKGAASHCRLCGVLQSTEVARVLNAYDVLVLPSRIEGFPNILAEAMAAGVVPVASRIRGVTDFIVADGVTGVLCRIGNTAAFAEAIATLARDRSCLTRMSRAARQAAEERFSLDQMGRNYDRVLRQVLAEAPLVRTPRPWSDFHMERAFNPGWRHYVPRVIKNITRQYLP